MSRDRAASVFALTVALLVAVACGGQEVGSQAFPAESPPSGGTAETGPSPAGEPGSTGPTTDIASMPTWTRYKSREAAYVVEYPSTWYRAEDRLTPELLDPLEVLAVGTYPLRSGGDRCQHHPVNALEDLGPSDAFIALYERADPSPGDYPKRPQRLSGLLEDLPRSGRFCVPDPERLDTWVPFSDGDRAFYLLVAIGKTAPDETRAQVTKILDSFRLTADRENGA